MYSLGTGFQSGCFRDTGQQVLHGHGFEARGRYTAQKKGVKSHIPPRNSWRSPWRVVEYVCKSVVNARKLRITVQPSDLQLL